MSQGHFGNLCDTDNFGDPVVLYDSYENRWFITDFAFKIDGGGNVNPQTAYQCFAVSKTGDPVNGGWNFYSILDPGGLGDYPKFGVWLTASTCRPTCSATPRRPRTSRRTWAPDKQQMYAGAPTVEVSTSPTVERLYAPPGQLTAPGRFPAGGLGRVLRLHGTVPERALDLQVPRRLGQGLHLDVHRPSTQLAPNCWPNATPANASTPANAADVLAIRAMAQAQIHEPGGRGVGLGRPHGAAQRERHEHDL
jgi:hypothetical protein